MGMFGVLLAATLATSATALPAEAAAAGNPGQAAVAPAVAIPAPAQVMAIPDGMREAFHARVLDTASSPELKLRRMVAFMLDEDGLALKYRADATNTVAEAYRTREGNCLSSRWWRLRGRAKRG